MKASIGFSCALLSVSAAFAHPGGLNAEGCHNNRKTGDYHCHGGKAGAKADARSAAARSPAQRMDKPPSTAGGQTCHTGPRGGTYTITKSGRKNYGGC